MFSNESSLNINSASGYPVVWKEKKIIPSPECHRNGYIWSTSDCLGGNKA